MKHRIALGAPAALAALGPLALPGVASAHTGRSAPVATDFVARIVRVAPSVDAFTAHVVDGDQMLWLGARPTTMLVVPGTLGEPLLRFDRRGVWLNLRSATAQSDRIDRLALRPVADPHAAPLWHPLTSGHSYAWHEHRLHVLEAPARARGRAVTLGPWSVPLFVDGRRYAIAGVLDYRPGPGPRWIAIACALALSAVAAAAWSRSAMVSLAVAATALTWALRVGRGLYGRPAVGVLGYLEIAATCVVGVALLRGLLHRDPEIRFLTAFVAAAGALYEGLTMLPVLTHSTALSTLPTGAAQLSTATVLGLGGGLLAGAAAGEALERPARRREPAVR
jgi:hypothetical protein